MRHKILWNFEIQKDHTNPRSDLVIIKKKKELVNWWIFPFQQTKKRNENIKKYLDLARELK